MALVWQNLLTKNGIVRSTNTTELYCMICECDTSYATCTKHVKTSSHLQHMQWFCLIYETSGNNVKCKICDAVIAWGKMKLHAKPHVKIPWSRPYDNYEIYKIFFENKIFRWQTLFNCCLCDAGFSSCELALVHITDPKHQSLKEKTPLAEDFLSKITSWELLVREGLVAFGTAALECRICGCKSVALSSVDRHVKGLLHLTSKSKFQLTLRASAAGDSVTTVDTENSESSGSDREQAEVAASTRALRVEDVTEKDHFALNYILKQNSSVSYCAICDCKLSNRATINHVMETAHVNALKRYGCDAISLKKGAYYYCGYCDCVICAPENVYHHVKGKRHLNSMKAATEQRVKTAEEVAAATKPEELAEPPVRRMLPCEYLVRHHETDVRCKVCDCIISASAMNLEIHVTGTYHNESLKKYGCERISSKGGNIYHCGYCNVMISHLENVYVHIKEASHMNLLTVADKRRSKPAMEVEDEVKVSRKVDLACPSYSCNYVPQKTTGFNCELRDVELSRERLQVESHVAGSDRANALKKYTCDDISQIGDRYHCACCECDILCIENVNKHVKGRKHLLNSGTVTGKLQLQVLQRRINELETVNIGPESSSALYSTTAEISRLVEKLSLIMAKVMATPDFT